MPMRIRNLSTTLKLLSRLPPNPGERQAHTNPRSESSQSKRGNRARIDWAQEIIPEVGNSLLQQ